MNSSKLIPLILLIIFSSCGKSTGERNLEKKGKKLDSLEQQLNAREEQINSKEINLNRELQRLDSLKHMEDTIGVYNPEIVGTWTITMNCIETNCEGSAIGDTKTEQWRIFYENDKVVAQAMSGGKVSRTYQGLFKANSLQLSVSEAAAQDIQMTVVLTPHPTAKGLMEGQRIISPRNCRTVYTLKAEKK